MIPRRIRLGFFVFLVLAFSASVGAVSFVHGPYSGAPSSDGVTISWSCEPAAPARVEYETWELFESTEAMGNSLLAPALEENVLVSTCHAEIDGLESGTDYVYRVILIEGETETASPIGTFSTAPGPGEPVSFAVLADTQQQLEGINRLALVADGIAADPTDFSFVLHGGDVVENPSSYYWNDWFDTFREVLLRAPFIPVLGNHEKNHRSYYDAFELPPGGGRDNERWWALHWGDLVIVGLDSNVKKATDYRIQQDWIREHLAGPEPHKFVIFHHPVFTSDATHESGSFFDKIYHPILVELDVDVVFNGHSHHYERIVRDDVVYMVVGGGGATPRQTKPEHIQGSDVSIERHYFYVRVHTSTNGIQIETISVGEELTDTVRVETEIIDSFALDQEGELLASSPESGTGRKRGIASVVVAGLLAAAAVVLFLRLSD